MKGHYKHKKSVRLNPQSQIDKFNNLRELLCTKVETAAKLEDEKLIKHYLQQIVKVDSQLVKITKSKNYELHS